MRDVIGPPNHNVHAEITSALGVNAQLQGLLPRRGLVASHRWTRRPWARHGPSAKRTVLCSRPHHAGLAPTWRR